MSPSKKEAVPAEPMDKKSLAKKAMAGLNKKYGSGTISLFSKWEGGLDIETIPTGSIGIDHITGRGGYPRGRITEIVGFESAGKSTLCLQAAAECQRMGGSVAYIDVECALDPDYAIALGVNLDELALSQPDSAEQALSIVEDLLEMKAFDMIVVDSVAALIPQAEVEAEMGKAQMGSQARLLSQAMRKFVPLVKSSNTALIMINQYRNKIGVMYGPSEVSVGGNALRYACTLRLEIRKNKTIKVGDNVIGNITKVKAIKNKIAAPHKTAEFNILFGKGIDRLGELVVYSVQHGVIEKAPAGWYKHDGENVAHGAPALRLLLETDAVFRAKVEKELAACLASGATVVINSDGEVSEGTGDDDDESDD